MKCPFCGSEELKVTDSRNVGEMNAIRRRRECLQCLRRFTTFETVDLSLQVKKRDGRYENFQLEKLARGLDLACNHTRVSHDEVHQIASFVVSELMERQVREISSTELGEMVIKRLKELDTVAYIRFACVYRRFKDVGEIVDAIHTICP